MIKVGKARLHDRHDYGGGVFFEVEQTLNVVEKTQGNYHEILVNPESVTTRDDYNETTTRSSKYDVFVGVTVAQAINVYKVANEELTWTTPLTEVA